MDTKRWIIFIVGIIVIFGGIIAYNKTQKASLPKSGGSSNVYGNLESKVTLTEFVDFQCEACYAYYPTIKEVKEKYKDRVKFQVRHFPIGSSHQHARLAASYAEAAAKQDKFWEMHDKIFEGQKRWEQSSEPAEIFDSYAKDIGLDVKKLRTTIEKPEIAAIINADLDAVKQLGGTGTPTFVLNGEKIDKIDNTVEAFSAKLDKALGNEKQN